MIRTFPDTRQAAQRPSPQAEHRPASRATLVSCPTCGLQQAWSEQNPHRPFCSSRCQDSDFMAWANERQFIPGDADYDAATPDEG